MSRLSVPFHSHKRKTSFIYLKILSISHDINIYIATVHNNCLELLVHISDEEEGKDQVSKHIQLLLTVEQTRKCVIPPSVK